MGDAVPTGPGALTGPGGTLKLSPKARRGTRLRTFLGDSHPQDVPEGAGADNTTRESLRAHRHRQDAKAVFEILVHEHADMLEGYLRSLLGAGSSVDDLFQETMLVAWRRLGDFDRSRSFAAWVRGIAQVLVLEYARKRALRPMTTDPHVLAEMDRRFEALARSPGDTLSDRAERLFNCPARLPETMREAINLVYARSLPIVAAAASVGSSEETLKKRVQRARQLLAECVGAGEAGP
jgi:RNA polymerase sigma factor (sigma-70 family)